MAITLDNTTISARTLRRGDDSFTLTAGEDLKIEGSGERLNVEVPGSKKWAVTIIVKIVETDA